MVDLNTMKVICKDMSVVHSKILTISAIKQTCGMHIDCVLVAFWKRGFKFIILCRQRVLRDLILRDKLSPAKLHFPLSENASLTDVSQAYSTTILKIHALD